MFRTENNNGIPKIYNSLPEKQKIIYVLYGT